MTSGGSGWPREATAAQVASWASETKTAETEASRMSESGVLWAYLILGVVLGAILLTFLLLR